MILLPRHGSAIGSSRWFSGGHSGVATKWIGCASLARPRGNLLHLVPVARNRQTAQRLHRRPRRHLSIIGRLAVLVLIASVALALRRVALRAHHVGLQLVRLVLVLLAPHQAVLQLGEGHLALLYGLTHHVRHGRVVEGKLGAIGQRRCAVED